jgi:hypothetical protein
MFLKQKASSLKLRFSTSIKKSLPDVHIFCMHADERDLLVDWAAWYAAILGKHHVHIFDKNSTMTQSLVVLQVLGSSGFDVSSGADFVGGKGVFLTRAMHEVQHSFLVPLRHG